jgi:hypothetical protein
VVTGIAGLVVPLLPIGPNRSEFQAQNLAYRVGAHTRELIFSVASIVAGAALYWHRPWARKLALGLLLVQTLYIANAFASGVSIGPPTARVRLFSSLVAVAWNGSWFYLVYRLVL